MRRQQGLLRPLVPLRDYVSFDRSTQDHSEKPDHSAKCEISFEVSSVHGNSPLRKRRLRGDHVLGWWPPFRLRPICLAESNSRSCESQHSAPSTKDARIYARTSHAADVLW